MEEITSAAEIADDIASCARYAYIIIGVVNAHPTDGLPAHQTTIVTSLFSLSCKVLEQSDQLDNLHEIPNLNWSQDDQQRIITSWNSLVSSVNSLLDSLSGWTLNWTHCAPEVRDKLKQLEVSVRRLGYFAKTVLRSHQNELTPEFDKLMSTFDAVLHGQR